MTKEERKDQLVHLIDGKQGAKATELAADKRIFEILGKENLFDLLEELIEEKRVVEVEYSLPNMSYRLKSFLLPGGSEVKVKGL